MQNHSNLSDSVLFFIGELAVNMDELLEANLLGLVNTGAIHEQPMRYESSKENDFSISFPGWRFFDL